MCPVGRLRNWVEMLANMQQEGAVSALLPHPSRLRLTVLPCVEAPLGESTVLFAIAGVLAHGFRWSSWSSCVGRGQGVGGGVPH